MPAAWFGIYAMEITIMAELHVQRKRNSHLWLWLIIIVIVLFLAGLFIYSRFDHQEQVIKGKPTSQTKTDFSKTKTINDV
jgi:heme/copper-type cytochrome/quinol oxidase subunit 2